MHLITFSEGLKPVSCKISCLNASLKMFHTNPPADTTTIRRGILTSTTLNNERFSLHFIKYNAHIIESSSNNSLAVFITTDFSTNLSSAASQHYVPWSKFDDVDGGSVGFIKSSFTFLYSTIFAGF